MQEIRESETFKILIFLSKALESYLHNALNIGYENYDQCWCDKHDMSPFLHAHFHLLDKTILIVHGLNFRPNILRIDVNIKFFHLFLIDSDGKKKRFSFGFKTNEFDIIARKFFVFIKKTKIISMLSDNSTN